MLRPGRLSESAIRGVPGLLLAVAAAGCGSLSPPAPEEPAPAAAPPGPPPRASHYGGPAVPVDLAPRERELLAIAPSCEPDARLALAARAHAADLSSRGPGRCAADLDHLRFDVLAAGGFDYGIQPFAATLDAAGREALADFVERRGARWSHCGVGVGGGVAVWIGVERPVEIEPVPVRLASGHGARVVGHIRGTRVTGVSAFLGLPDGGVRPLVVRGTSPFEIRLPPGPDGRYELELLADSGSGPEVAALLPIWLGVAPDQRPLVFQEPPGDEDRDPEALLYELVREVRRRAGLEPLWRDAALEALARAHSAEMAREGFFGHVSPNTGTLADRLGARELAPSWSAENVARSGSAWRAHRNLVQSPSHRMHLIDPRFTHVGIGVSRDGMDVIVTQVFAGR